MSSSLHPAVHVGAHIINAVNFSTNYNSEYVALNVARYKNEVRTSDVYFVHVLGVWNIFTAILLQHRQGGNTAKPHSPTDRYKRVGIWGLPISFEGNSGHTLLFALILKGVF